MYYLNSRYYDPVIGRFINADTTDVLTANPTSLTDKNLYTYCDNNPVNRIDENGDIWKSALTLSHGGSLLAVSTAIVETFGNAVMAAIGTITPVGWAVIGAVTVAVVVIYVAPKVVDYVASKSVTKAKGKKATDSSKNEKHGDNGRAMEKAQKQVAKLREQQAKAKTGKEKNEIQKKINNILNIARKNGKGGNHSQRAKR